VTGSFSVAVEAREAGVLTNLIDFTLALALDLEAIAARAMTDLVTLVLSSRNHKSRSPPLGSGAAGVPADLLAALTLLLKYKGAVVPANLLVTLALCLKSRGP
jgi:hypothetical protein